MIASISRSARVRIAPFALFMVLLGIRGALPDDGTAGFDPRWIYGIAVLGVGGLLWAFRREYGEFSPQLWPTWREAGLAAAVGLVVFWLWIHLDTPMLRLGDGSAPFHPTDAAGARIWPLIVVRWIGAALVVPLMEELFWRSFLMRWIADARFESVPPQQVGLKALVLSTFVFMLAHTLWLAAIIAGLAYAWLYIRSGKLWLAVIAHGVTNGALGIWVIATGNWAFW
jgi:CAAX prenyl protease-like protein